MKNYNWNILNIATWNKIRFPDNTKSKQIIKLESEIAEWKNAKNKRQKLEELADVFIASAGLTRFSNIGDFICFLLQIIDEQTANKQDHISLKDAVDSKMLINRERTFDENMHHI